MGSICKLSYSINYFIVQLMKLLSTYTEIIDILAG